MWLDQNKPSVAKSVFDLARPALIKAKEYRVAGRYLNPTSDFKRLQSEYQEMIANKDKAGEGEKLQKFAEHRFSNGAATLVALLVVNDRKFEAAQIAEAASREWDSKEFQDLLKQAWEGHVPDPWP